MFDRTIYDAAFYQTPAFINYYDTLLTAYYEAVLDLTGYRG